MSTFEKLWTWAWHSPDWGSEGKYRELGRVAGQSDSFHRRILRGIFRSSSTQFICSMRYTFIILSFPMIFLILLKVMTGCNALLDYLLDYSVTSNQLPILDVVYHVETHVHFTLNSWLHLEAVCQWLSRKKKYDVGTGFNCCYFGLLGWKQLTTV